jgi:putative SOS response-associated peptidase YedK
MCNLYSLKKSAAEVASYFGVSSPAEPQFNAPEETLPGYPGLVVREQDGARVLESMTWGFPLRLKGMKPESKPKAVNNVADIRKPMWSGLAKKPQWRCLAPATHFAEPEGSKGRMIRTWFTVKGEPIFAWAGLSRISDEWGKVYSCAMTDCNEAIRPVHDRMPVLLHRDEWGVWLRGTFEECCALQDRCFPDDLIEMNRTTELWSKNSKAAREQAGTSLI